MSGRARTAIDTIAEAYLDDSAALDPVAATRAGIPGHDRRLPDLHPAWHEEYSQLRRRTLEALAAAEPADANDRTTAAALRAQLEAAEGAAFDLKSFHRRVLDIGSVGLDVLRSAVLGRF